MLFTDFHTLGQSLPLSLEAAFESLILNRTKVPCDAVLGSCLCYRSLTSLLQNLWHHLLVMHQSAHQVKCHLDEIEMSEDNKGRNKREEDKKKGGRGGKGEEEEETETV